MQKFLKKFVKTRAKQIPKWTNPNWMIILAVLVFWAGWVVVKPFLFHLHVIPVLGDFIFTEDGLIFCTLVGWVLMLWLYWKLAIPLICRCIQVWFPEDFDAYKIEDDTLADT